MMGGLNKIPGGYGPFIDPPPKISVPRLSVNRLLSIACRSIDFNIYCSEFYNNFIISQSTGVAQSRNIAARYTSMLGPFALRIGRPVTRLSCARLPTCCRAEQSCVI